jgi:hypothetical protein
LKSRWLATIGIAAALAVSACSGGGPRSSQSSQPAQSASSAAAPTVPPTVTTAPPTPTTAPTVAPSPTEAPAPTEAATSTPVAQTAPGGPAVEQGDIKAMAQAWASAKSYKMTVVSNDPQNKGTILIEIVRPDRQHTKMTMGGQTFESISIGQDSYLYFNGKWTKTTGKSASTLNIAANPSQTVDQINQGIKEGESLTKGGVSAVDSQPCQEWVFTGKDANSSGTMCIGLANNLPLQFKSADGKWVMKFSDWNASISIEPPI